MILFVFAMIFLLLASIFLTNFKNINQTSFLKTVSLVVFLLIYSWTSSIVIRDVSQSDIDSMTHRFTFLYMYLLTCCRTIANCIIVFATLYALCILLKNQIKNPIVFDVLWSHDSWYIYPVLFYSSEHTAKLLFGGDGVPCEILNKFVQIVDPHIALQYVLSKSHMWVFIIGCIVSIIYMYTIDLENIKKLQDAHVIGLTLVMASMIVVYFIYNWFAR